MEKNSGLSKNVVILGFVSFFNDLASEMVYPIVPIFLTSVLGAPVSVVGLIEGIAESTASLLKFYTGWLSDKIKKRKKFVAYGYALSTFSKFIIGIAMSWHLVLVGRFLDRFGKGIRTSARDALIAESSLPENIGKSFGFHRALDTAGAVFGPLTAILLINNFGNNNLRPIFYIALIPGCIGVLVLIALLKEKTQSGAKAKSFKFHLSDLNGDFKIFLIVSTIFALGNSSDAFLILRAQSLGLTTTFTILAYVVFNVVYALTSYSAGSLSDKTGPKKILICSFFLFAVIYLLFGINQSAVWIWILFALYGLYMAISEGIGKAYITRISNPNAIATTFGTYQAVVGACTFFSSLIAGILWSKIGAGAPFVLGAVLAFIAGTIFALSSFKEH